MTIATLHPIDAAYQAIVATTIPIVARVVGWLCFFAHTGLSIFEFILENTCLTTKLGRCYNAGKDSRFCWNRVIALARVVGFVGMKISNLIVILQGGVCVYI